MDVLLQYSGFCLLMTETIQNTNHRYITIDIKQDDTTGHKPAMELKYQAY
jgi:hypothetical protein